MRVLGIDPGTIRLGYAVVDFDNPAIDLVECGVVRAPAKKPIEQRLLLIYERLRELIGAYRPAVVAIEQPFVVQAPRNSALAVGEARAVTLLAAAGHELPVVQYTPSKVRQTVAGYGAVDKEQVLEALSLVLGRPLAGYSLDATDALAVAVCHTQHANLAALMEQATEGRPR